MQWLGRFISWFATGSSNRKMYMCNLFLFITESNITNHTDDTTLYEYETNLTEVETKIENESLKVFKWFWNILKQKLNGTKSHVILTTNTLQLNVEGNIISNKLSFEPHLNKVYKIVGQKLHALARISS